MERKPANNFGKPKTAGTGTQFKKKKTGDDGRGGGRQSLKLGTTTKRGRSAEEAQRRGSLKKKNRSADKQARAEANLERRTVQLKE
jgi:hypothetical protein